MYTLYVSLESESRSTAYPLPRALPWLIGLTPVFPLLSLLSMRFLFYLRILPLKSRVILLTFGASQLIAALWTPTPFLSALLALVKVILILGSVSLGVFLGNSQRLLPLLYGQLFIFASAWVYTIITLGWSGISMRLGHPYYYVVSLGLTCAISFWFLWIHGRKNRFVNRWRVPLMIFYGATLLASGSRGAIIALASGALVAYLSSRWRTNWIAVCLIVVPFVLFGIFYFFNNDAAVYAPVGSPFKRILSIESSGRNIVWEQALTAWRTFPIGGVGSYQGGTYLHFLFNDGCQLTTTLVQNGVECPQFAKNLYGVWLTAHNTWIHSLLENGIIGTLGLLLLTIYGMWYSFWSNDFFITAVLFGFMYMGFVDVVNAVPSPHFSELWWCCLGIALSRGLCNTKNAKY